MTRNSRLYNFLYEDRQRRWKYYAWTMATAFLWGCVNTLILDRSEQQVTYEVLAICVLAHLGLILYLSLRGESIVKDRKYRRRRRSTVPPAPVAAQVLPRWLPAVGVAALIILAAMTRVDLGEFDATVISTALRFAPTRVAGESVPRILDNARLQDLALNPRTLRKSGLKFIRASEKDRSAWPATTATLDYISYLNRTVAPKITSPKDITADLQKEGPYTFGLNILSNPNQEEGLSVRVSTEGVAPPDKSARLEMLASPQPRGSGAKLIIIEGKIDGIRLDGQYLKDVVIKDAKVGYDGGPARLENVYFVDCQFTISPNDAGRALAKAALQYGAITFSWPR